VLHFPAKGFIEDSISLSIFSQYSLTVDNLEAVLCIQEYRKVPSPKNEKVETNAMKETTLSGELKRTPQKMF
jgi:hypothetical protein